MTFTSIYTIIGIVVFLIAFLVLNEAGIAYQVPLAGLIGALWLPVLIMWVLYKLIGLPPIGKGLLGL